MDFQKEEKLSAENLKEIGESRIETEEAVFGMASLYACHLKPIAVKAETEENFRFQGP
ncbi:MAG: hypothetical protein WC836_01425 [Desulfobacula sp.]|jgi:hypothetical protein